MELIPEKQEAYGRPNEREAAKVCSEGLLKKYDFYISRTRNRLSNLRNGSKAWWKLSSQILTKAKKSSSIPSLKQNNRWYRDAKEKADLFAEVFSTKWVLPDPVIN